MAWKKSSPELQARFQAALPIHPGVEHRKMFGYPCCFVNGNFFTGLFEESVVVRLPGGLKEHFPELASAPTFDPRETGRGMKDWWLLPDAVSSDEQRLARFFAAAFKEVQKLPAKEKKPKAAKKKSPRGKK